MSGWPVVSDYNPPSPQGIADFNRSRIVYDSEAGGGYYVVDDHRVTCEVYDSFRAQWDELYRTWWLFCVMAGLTPSEITRRSIRADLQWHQNEIERLRSLLLAAPAPADPEEDGE